MPGTKGNRNALKHGFYAHLWTDAERAGLEQAGKDNDITGEIHLLRVIIRRIATNIPEKIAKNQMGKALKIANTLTLAVSSLSTLVRTELLAGGQAPDTETAILEAIERFRLEQGI